MALVRDPAFWRRFSMAVRLDEEVKASTEHKESTIWSDNWIRTQRQKRRRTVLYGSAVFLATAILITAIVLIILWFRSHGWLRHKQD